MNWRMLLVLTFALGILIPFAGCTSDDDDDPPPPPPPEFGPSMIAVGDNGNILVSGNTSTWTVITATGSLATLDLDEVVMVPGHASRRLVTFGDDSSLTVDAEIWFSDDGGTTWTEAIITELTGVRAASDYDIVDIHFVNALDGYALGTNGLVLMTVDAGTNWTEMNVWSDPGLTTNPGDVELNLGVPTGTNPVQGTAITQGQGATPLVD
ncbi:MAG: WD40/YVTN/BNR-like repeat-containing protein, partial [Planctomycetota bacterium]